MRFTGFSAIYSAEYNINKIFAMHQFWNTNQQFSMNNPRPTNALLLFSGCSARFFDNETKSIITIPKGSLFYIPAGATYSWTFLESDPENVSTALFEFLLTDANGNNIEIGDRAEILEVSENNLYGDLFNSIVLEFSRPVISGAGVKAAAYNIIGLLSGEGRANKINNVKTRIIERGINYLETDPNQAKSIKEIAKMCNVSINYFERLFKEYSGVTPSAYRIQKKLQKAKLLLANDTLNIDQISLRLGFEDTAYFCRLFKKQNGCTPTEYRNKIRP